MRRAAAIVAVAMVSAACSSGHDRTIVVGAASSLSDVLPDIAAAYQEAGGAADVSLVFSGSQLLAAQAIEGAPFDLLITADQRTMERISDVRKLPAGPFRLIGNDLTIVVSSGNPRGIQSPADLEDPDLIVALADSDVPVGAYTAQALARAGVAIEPDSREPSARAVLARVQQGEADAGIVYVTDVRSANDVEGVTGLPRVGADYYAARLADPPDAEAFLTFVQGEQAAALLADAGFTP